MTDYEDRELEEQLRSFPTAAPSEALRERVLRAAGRSAPGRATWKQGLAYTLILLGLLALDVAVDRAQSARLSRLIGDGRIGAAADSDTDTIAALEARRAMIVAMVEGRQLP